MGKFKAIVEFFKRSSTAQTKLESTLKQMGLPILKLKQECPTRLNSCYEMLDRILKIKDGVISNLALLPRHDLNPSTTDWETAAKTVPILQPFYEITTEISTETNVSLSKVLVFSQIMNRHVSRLLTTHAEDENISNLLNSLQTQLHIMFNALETHPLYADTCILDPRFKKKGFRTQEAFHKGIEILRVGWPEKRCQLPML